MPSDLGFYDVITIDGVRYRLAAPVAVEQLATYPGKITIGDYTKDSDPRLSAWIIRDLSGGHGIAELEEGADQNRDRWATLNTRYPGQWAPPYASAAYTAAADTTGARPLGDLNEAGTYRFYAAYGTKLVKWDETGLAYGSSLGTLTAVPVDKAVAYRGTGAARKLFIPMGASGYATYSDAAAFANVAAGASDPAAQSFLLWADKLIALDTAGQLWYSTSGAAASFTSYGASGKLDTAYVPRHLVSFFDQANNPAIFVVSDQATWAFDPAGPSLYRVAGVDTPGHPYAGLGAAEWRQHLFLTLGMGVRRYTGDIAQPMGLDRDNGLPLNYRGRILDLESETNGLYALCIGGVSGSTSYAHLQVWTDYGWHTVWADTATSTTTKTTWCRVSQAQSTLRLWWGDGSGNLRTIALPLDDANPRAQLVDGVGSFASGTYEVQTGEFDAAMSGIDKVASHLFVKVRGTGTTGSLIVSYRINQEANWTTLGTQSFAGGTRSVNFRNFGDQLTNFATTGDYEGLIFQEIELRFQLSDPACWVDHAVLYFMKVQPPARSFTMQIDLTAPLDDQSPDRLNDLLNAVLNAGLFVEMVYRGAGTIADEYVRAKVIQVSGIDASGQDTRGLRQVTILEVPDTVSIPAVQAASTPEFRAASTVASGSGTTITVTKPTGTTDGDLLVAVIMSDNTTPTAPAGWARTSVNNTAIPSSNYELNTYYKIASSEGASWSWTITSSIYEGFVCAYTGVHATPAIAASENTSTSNASCTGTSVTTATQNALIILVGATTSSSNIVPPGTMTERVDSSGSLSTFLCDEVQGSVGASGNKTATWDGTDNWASHLLAFKAAGT